MQIKVTASLLLALGFVSAVAWLFASRADARLAPLPQVSSSGLPAPRSMVVFDSLNDAPAGFNGQIDFAVNASFTVVTVPANRWLVITDFDIVTSGSIDLVEDLAGVLTVKRQALAFVSGGGSDSFHSSVGLSFAPGSQVVLRSRTTNSTSARYHFAGYWVAP
ncbi:MAG: hypothetical protein JNN27_13170 [Planctomycetes bacterium]|nr:hypothetical protein [Planctomycetota bacterium]